MSVYLDASALMAVLLREPTRQAVERFLQSEPSQPTISSFCIGECSAAIAGLATMARKTEAEATVLLAALDQWIAVTAIAADVRDADIVQATRLVRRLDLRLRLPDAIHISTAQRLRATLVTLDRAQACAARAAGVACINPAESSA
ncbi:hypothetical protein BH10PSE2_BH10PSE2_18690 [soil metagenome]